MSESCSTAELVKIDYVLIQKDASEMCASAVLLSNVTPEFSLAWLRKRSHFLPSYEKANFSKTLSEIIKLLLVSDTDRDLSEMSFVHVVPKLRKSH